MDEKLTEIPEAVRDDIEKRSNVVGTAVGEVKENGASTGEVGMVVLVTEKLPEEALSTQDLVPESVQIEGKQYRTDVVEVGHLNAQGVEQRPGERPAPGDRRGGQRVGGRTREREDRLREATTPVAEHVPELRNRKTRLRPAPAGVSVAHEAVTAGTLGSPPLETVDGTRVFLTNAHVAAPIDEASTGDPILQPGPADGGTSQDVVGQLLEWSIIEREQPNVCDSALVEIDDDVVADDVLALGDFAGWAQPEIGVEYVKSGRTTGVTSGELRARNGRVQVGGYFPGETITFEGVDVFTPMSAGGDSGGLIGIQRDDGFYATDLLFGGSDRATIGVPMTVVQDLHGPLTPVETPAGPGDTGPGGTTDGFRERIHQRLASRFGAENVAPEGDGRVSDYRVDAWPVPLAVVVADSRERAMDSVGRAMADADGESLPVVLYPAEAGDRPQIGGFGVAIIPVQPT